MRETSKARGRRLADGWFRKYFIGDIIDIGCGDDPVTETCRRWDIEDGDAQALPGIPPESFDCVYSSHCGEHIVDFEAGIHRWWEVLRPGGHLVIILPDEDLYEQGVWPSRWNADHKHTLTIHKSRSWSPVSINLVEVLASLPNHKIVAICTADYGYDYRGGEWDRTLCGGEAAIEAVIRKLRKDE